MPPSVLVLGPLPPFCRVTRLAAGASATVSLVTRQDAPGDWWALKELHPHVRRDATKRAAFAGEARCNAQFSHPHIVPACAFDPAGALGLAYVDGVSLAYLLDYGRRAGTPLPAAVVVRIVLDVLAALGAIHAHDGATLVHGDVGPRNVLVDQAGCAWLCDFGACAPANVPTPFRGTLAYAAPEAIQGAAVGPASDVFSAAVMLWEALRGERLFRRQTPAETLVAVVEQRAPYVDRDRPELRPLRACLAEALQPLLAARLPTASALAHRLAQGAAAAARDAVGVTVMHWAEAELLRRQRALAAAVARASCSSG